MCSAILCRRFQDETFESERSQRTSSEMAVGALMKMKADWCGELQDEGAYLDDRMKVKLVRNEFVEVE